MAQRILIASDEADVPETLPPLANPHARRGFLQTLLERLFPPLSGPNGPRSLPSGPGYIQSVLEPEGYIVGIARTPHEFWKMLEQQVPDLIILDETLDEMNGTALLQRLRQHSAAHHVPVMMLIKDSRYHDIFMGLQQD